MLNKKNIPLFVALAVPILMILLVAAFVYLPAFGQKPKTNFVYMSGNNNYYGYGYQEYQVKNGYLVKNEMPTPTPPSYYQPPMNNDDAHFYFYDVNKNQAKEISFTDAQQYKLDSSTTSSDGYMIQQGNGGGGDFLFGGPSGDYSSWFIKGHNRSLKLNLKLSGNQYYNNFQFLGWVE